MLPDAAKHPGLPVHAIQSYLYMPSKPDARITHVLAICTVHVQEVQWATAFLPVISWTKEWELYPHTLTPHWWCVTTHLGSMPGADSSPQSAADFSCRSACSLWGFLLSFLVILSVPALISIWLTFQSPDRLRKRLPSATATMWKVSEQILSLTQLSPHWSDLHCCGRGDLNSQCTALIYQVKWGKESKVSECPCCLQAAEPSSLSLPRLLKNSFPSQHTIPFISSCSPLTGKRKLVSLCHHIQESHGCCRLKPHQRR